MSTPKKSEYMLLFRGTDWHKGLSPEEIPDGPFAESKEAIGGFFLLEVASLDEAAEIAKEFPGLNYGATVEVRPVAPECPLAFSSSEKSAVQPARAGAPQRQLPAQGAN